MIATKPLLLSLVLLLERLPTWARARPFPFADAEVRSDAGVFVQQKKDHSVTFDDDIHVQLHMRGGDDSGADERHVVASRVQTTSSRSLGLIGSSILLLLQI